MKPPKVPFAVLDDRRMFGQIAKFVRLNPMLVFFPPIHGAFSGGTAVGSFFHGMLANGVSDHFRGQFVGGGEVDFVAQVQQKDLGLFPTAHWWNVRGGRLRGIDRRGACATNFVHRVVIGGAVLAQKHRLLRFIEHHDDQVFPGTLLLTQIIPPQSMEVEEHLEQQTDIFFST